MAILAITWARYRPRDASPVHSIRQASSRRQALSASVASPYRMTAVKGRIFVNYRSRAEVARHHAVRHRHRHRATPVDFRAGRVRIPEFVGPSTTMIPPVLVRLRALDNTSMTTTTTTDEESRRRPRRAPSRYSLFRVQRHRRYARSHLPTYVLLLSRVLDFLSRLRRARPRLLPRPMCTREDRTSGIMAATAHATR